MCACLVDHADVRLTWQRPCAAALQQAEDAEAAPPGAAVEAPDLASGLEGLEEQDGAHAAAERAALEQAAEDGNGDAKAALLAPEAGACVLDDWSCLHARITSRGCSSLSLACMHAVHVLLLDNQEPPLKRLQLSC